MRRSIFLRKLPEYYPTMYMDGYEPWEILQALHESMRKEYYERKELQKEAQDENISYTIEVKTK